MTPTLPPELLSEILGLATVDQEPAEQQKTRNAFRLVCRDWCESMDYWKEICVEDCAMLARLVRMIAVTYGIDHDRVSAALQVKELYVKLDVTKRPGCQAAVDEACFLLGCAGTVKQLWLEINEANVPPLESTLRSGSIKGHPWQRSVVIALAQLNQLNSFTLTGKGTWNTLPAVDASLVAWMTRRWPALECFAWEDCSLTTAASSLNRSSQLGWSTNLRTVHLKHVSTRDDVFAAALSLLPNTVTTLSIDDRALLSPTDRHHVRACLGRADLHLARLKLGITAFSFNMASGREPRDGYFDDALRG